ncbi:hypothetical protein QTP86_007709 [Hemibagrus guttatus]|nr:hypothetical protein QTP86_007709 [Hemibagrus guttatus]
MVHFKVQVVQEWLCLNCQMQRALGMDMDTPRSKSQQQIHSPQQPTKAQPRTAPQTPSSIQPKPFPASQNELKSQSQPSTPLKTQTQAKPPSQTIPSTQSQVTPQPQTTPSTQSQVKPQPQTTPSAQTQAKPQPQTTPSAQTQAKPQPQTTPSAQTQAKPQPQTTPSAQTQAKPQPQTTPSAQTQAKPQPQTTPLTQTQAKPQSQPPTPSQTQPKFPSTPQTQRKSQSQPATPTKSQPNPPPSDQPFGKLFGFGASLLNQASSLISVDQLQPQSQPQTPQKTSTAAPKPGSQPGTPSQQQKSRPKVCCPLCKTELNVGVPTEPPNYNHCTQCHTQVCNMCGFNPTPHLTEKKEWLCLACQTQRAISGDLGDGPSPVPQQTGSPRVPGPTTQQQAQLRPPSQQAGVRHAGPQQQKTPGAQVSGPPLSTKQGTSQSKGPAQVSPAKTGPTQPASKSKAETRKQEQGISKKQAVSKTEKEGDLKVFHKKGTQEAKDQKKSSDLQKSKHHDDSNKSSTQSLSDTGYSSDGISGSQSEITGLIREDGIKLSEGGLSTQRSPPSPSEIKKLESSMRPLLQSETATDADKQRPHSLSITQDQFDSDGEVSDDLSCKLRHDYVEDSSESGLSPLPTRQKLQKDLTDEELMRRQILEMSADEEEMVEAEGHVKIKKSHKHSGDLGKERRRLTQQSNSFEDDTKSNDGTYKSSDGDDLMGSQGGLRRFKTIELNNTNSYNRDLELSTEHDLREPELEMESLTGSPEERSRGEYSSTLPATTPSYTSGTSPTSVSSLEDDSDSSPSRRQRLEEVKQQRKARHRSHGPLLPTIEDSSEEDELREEEELLREQEKMRDLEQQRIRSTARKTKRDKEELRAQRRRERSKTPPSNLSPIEDASPTEELRQAAEMEELHRSSCSEYSPSMDSEAEGFEVGSKLYRSGRKPHVLMVQLDESGSSQGGTVTHIVKREETPPAQDVLDLTGQIKSENQVACCDVVYQLPFAGSCSGPFAQRGKTTISEPNPSAEPTPAPHQQTHPEKDGYQPVNVQGVSEEHKPYTMAPPGRLPPSMSDTNLAESGLQYYQRTDPGDLAVDLSSMKQAYEAGYLGMGAQYGSYTDLRHQGDVSTPPLPLRRYGSMSNISGDFGYPSRDLTGTQEPNLAQYSATTAREISRMCAALNSMDQFGNRYTNSSDLLQFGAGRGGPIGRLGLQQGLTSLRANLLYGPDGRPTAHGQALTSLINARQASLRALYPPALRTADGMIYSTINTPIASTLPITTQPAPVLNSMLRGVYRPYPSGSVTAVSLSSLSRLPHVTPRMPLSAQGPYRYPAPTHFPASAPDSISGGVPTTSTSQETPVYLGKPTVPVSISSTTTLPSAPRPTVQTSAVPAQSTILNQQTSQGHIPVDATTVFPPSQSQIPQSIQQQMQAQTQSQSLTKSIDLSFTQGLSLAQTQTHTSVPQSQPHATTRVLPDSAASGIINTTTDEKEKEEERLRQQQEQLLQLERERIELEKLRQLRLQEELERDRLELQRHREKEQLLVQREIQELQSIKHQVLQQQQVERETQLVMQREQLAQQRMQLDHIQALQQQLQLQLEEQKRQKTAAVEAAAAVAAAEAAAASAAAAAAATTAQGAINGMVVGGAHQAISIICDQSGRVIPQDGQSLQFLPCMDGQMVQALVSTRPMPSSASEMSLRNSDDQGSSHAIKKQNSMPRLRNGTEEEPVKRIADSSVQTDDEDAEDRFMSRRRRTRRIADCSVQTDEEDQGEWDSQPVRRRRSRYSKHSESGAENKSDTSKVTSSIAIQTTSDSSCQTESEQLGRVSPAIHITMAETSKVELLHYISAPERTHKGESLACQTDPEAQSQGVVAPQLSVPTTVSPYSTSLQVVGATPAKFERRKPDPLDIGLQTQQPIDARPPKSPHVLYSPVSPLSPHRMLETTFASSEKLNRAHVTPQQKAFTTESPKRHQTIPRPIKSVQRSMSDPKPLSPTSEDPSKTKFSLYQSQNSSGSQLQNSMMRKVKRTLPSPPPDETPLPIVTPAMTHMYSTPGMPQRVLPRNCPAQGVTKAGLLSELKAVEQESSKLRKQQAELEEEEKEIDAKLRCLELGITQRKETMVKERERRELAYLRGIGDARDYMSDSELNNLRLTGVPTGTYEANGMLSRPSTAPLSQFTSDPNVTSQYPPTSSYVPYPFPQSQPAPTQQPTAAYQQIGFQAPQYPVPSQPQPGTFQPHPPQPSSYQTQGPYQSHAYAQSYLPDLGMQQPSHQSFPPPAAHLPGQTLPYPGQSMPFQPQGDILSGHQLPRHTSLADLEQKLPTNYEIITNPAVSVATSAQETGFSGAYSSPLTNAYGPYRTPDQTMADHIPSPTSGYGTDGLYTTNLEQNIPRNYVMIDDISELTKENMGSSDASRTGYGGENGPRGIGYGDGSEDLYGRPGSTTSYHHQGAVDSHGRPSTTASGGSSYYYDDYKHSSRSSSGMGSQKHSSKNLAPAAVSSKRSKHRKQGMEQKISKFSPIEEARDVESDLASYTMTTPSGGSCTMVSRSGVKKNVYDQQKYYGSREGLDEDDRLYSSGRSRSTGYGMDKISSRDSGGYRSKSYERDAMERSQRGTPSRSGRTAMRTQNSEEESPLSPVGKPVSMGRVSDPHDVRNQYGSSHSLPDVQDHHIRDIPKSHAYKPDDPYVVDDMHCAVSDSEAYHLGQEETDWFEKPREGTSDRSRHHGSGSHSSSGKRSHVKHTYHDYDEPPEEDLWPQDEYNHQRHSSSIPSREHRHHVSSSGRHSSSRHSSEESRSSRSSRSHPKDPSARSEGRSTSSSSHKRSSEPRSSQSGYRDSGEYSHDPASGHHHSASGQRGQRQSSASRRQESPSSKQQQQQQQLQQGSVGQQQPPQQGQQRSTTQPTAGRQPVTQQPETGPQGQPTGQQIRTQQQQPQPQPGQQPATTTSSVAQPTTVATGIGAGAAQHQAKPGQAPASGQPLAAGATIAQPTTAGGGHMKPDTAPTAPTPAIAIGSKAAPQPAKAPTTPATGIGSKAAPRPGGIGSAAQPTQQPADSENVFSKILPGGAAEQAGKLGDESRSRDKAGSGSLNAATNPFQPADYRPIRAVLCLCRGRG